MPPDSATPRRLDALLLAAPALIAYALLGQQTFYKIDGPFLVDGIARHAMVHHNHTFYFPLARLLGFAGAWLGWTNYECARAFSALGTALGVFMVHVTCRTLGLSRGRCNLVTALVAASGPVVFFATVAEVHGPFFAFAGIALWTAARFVRDPRPATALVLGLGLGLAYVAHPTGVLMAAMLPWLLILARPDLLDPHRLRLPRRVVGLGALSGAVVGAVIALAPPLLRRLFGATTAAGEAVEYLLRNTSALTDPLAYGEAFAEEWLLPFLPLSALALLSLVRERRTLTIVAALVALLPYLLTCVLLLAGYDEQGAYLLPLALPTAMQAVRVLPRRAAAIAVVLAATSGVSVYQVVHHDRAPRRALAEGIVAAAGGRPAFLLLGDRADLEAFQLHLCRDFAVGEDVLFLGDIGRGSAESMRVKLAQLDALLDRKRLEGRTTYVSEGAFEQLRILERTGLGAAAGMIVRHLQARYELRSVTAAGFRGFRLQQR